MWGVSQRSAPFFKENSSNCHISLISFHSFISIWKALSADSAFFLNVRWSNDYFLNMTNEDILSLNSGKKFDIVLMNPPYATRSNQLHLKFIEKCMTVSDTTVVVCPANWLEDYAVIDGWKKSPISKYVDSLGKYLNDYDLYDVAEFQKIMQMSGWSDGMVGVFKTDNENTELYKDIISNLNDSDIEIIEKVAKLIYTGEQQSIKKEYKNHKNEKDYKWFIKLTKVHGHVNNKDTYDIIPPDIKYSLNVPDKEEKEVYFKTKNEAVNFFNSLKTDFCKYLKKLKCYGLGDFNGGLPFMGDYTKPWTDERFYEYFNISEEAQNQVKQFFIDYYKKFDK